MLGAPSRLLVPRPAVASATRFLAHHGGPLAAGTRPTASLRGPWTPAAGLPGRSLQTSAARTRHLSREGVTLRRRRSRRLDAREAGAVASNADAASAADAASNASNASNAATPRPSPPALLESVSSVVAADAPDAVITRDHAAAAVLDHPTLIVSRQLELLNVFIGYEQANQYQIQRADGTVVGYMAEQDVKLTSAIARQLLSTRRAYRIDVMDTQGRPILKMLRPVKWLLNSRLIVMRPEDDAVIGEVQTDWHLWRRRYDVFLKKHQIARIDGGFWAWDFVLRDEQNAILAQVNRNFVGLARELFSDTGVYVVRMSESVDALQTLPGTPLLPGAAPHATAYGAGQPLPPAVLDAPHAGRPLSFDERALVLATAVTADIDYFSRHSSGIGGGGGIMPFPIFMPFGFGGGGSDDGAVEDGSAPAPVPAPGPTADGGGDGGGFDGGAGGGGGGGAPVNEWGESPFLSDDDVAGNAGDDGFSWSDFFDD